MQPLSKAAACVEVASKVYRPFSRQQDALDFAAECNAAAAEASNNSSHQQGGVVKVSEDLYYGWPGNLHS